MYPCPALPNAAPGTPRMCKQCQFMWSALYHTSTLSLPQRRCQACALPMDDTPPHTAYPGCLVYALLHQNIIFQRWHDIQDALKPAPPLQQHRSIHIPDAVLGTFPPQTLGGTPSPPALSPTHPPRHVIHLTLHAHAYIEIDAVLAPSTADNSSQVHLYHPHMHLTLSHLRRL